MRTENSIKNISIGIFSQIVIVLLGFLSRKVFIDSLGIEYLGINGFLTNVLSLLSLVEGGIGTSIVYNIYKPLAENNIEKVTALVQLYKKMYSIIAVIVFLLSLGLYPFLNIFIKGDSSISYITIVYFIFVFRNMISYLNAHKWSLINADQKGYILARVNLIFNIITTVSKICILILTQNYIVYLIIDILIYIIQNIYNGQVVERRYPYIKTKKKYKVENEIKSNVVTNVKALFLHNIGGYCIYGTDNILISALVNINTVGLYSNYTLVSGQLGNLINPIINSIGDSIGNLIATEDNEKMYKIFKVTYLINFWVYSVSTIFLLCLLEPFISWAFGNGLLLDKLSFIFILINFYINGMRGSIANFKNKGGIFAQDKYVPLIESLINLGASIILAKYFGLAGIFMGTTISNAAIPLWNRPRLVYKYIFNKSVKEYMKTYMLYIFYTLIAGTITLSICSLVIIKNQFISLIIKGVICVIVPNVMYIVLLRKTYEFNYIVQIIKNNSISKKIKLKFVR